jgi:L-malate glycosyltransferase
VSGRPLRILHCHSTFSLGGKEARATRLMNLFEDQASHVVLSAVPDALGARDAIDPSVKVEFPGDAAPPLHGKPSFGRYRLLSRYMAQFDLVLTYNWGSMDAVGAKRLFPKGVPRLVHHEDGFNADEALKPNWKRSGFRRLMLPAADAVVVVSDRLEKIAKSVWKCPEAKLLRIPNGIDVDAYGKPAFPSAIPALTKQSGDVVIGTLAGLREVKNLPRLVRAAAAVPNPVRLVIVGEGPEKPAILAEAARLGFSDRLIMPGFLPNPANYVGLFDIFALSSDSEQFPISLVEAMAAGKPAVTTDVGDVMAMVSPENRDYVVPATDEAAFSDALARLAADANLRTTIGTANLAKATAEFNETDMAARYAALYGLHLPKG